jgi:hypothetical protein
MNEIKPESQDAGENAALRNAPFPADEPGDTTTFVADGTQTITPDGPKSEHIQAQDEFWVGVENADQTPRQVENMAAPLNPNELPGSISNRGDNTGDTDSSVLI